MRQNVDKKEALLRFVGPGAVPNMEEAYQTHPPQLPVVNGRLGATARYLGPHLHVSMKVAH